MRALSIRQPYAELILRGIKVVEFRSRSTTIVGERFHIYASRQWAAGKLYLEGCGVPPSVVSGQSSVVKRAWSDDLEVPDADGVRPWMRELADMLILRDLPAGVVVGSAVIEKVDRGDDFYQWHLTGVERAKRLRKPRGHPQPVWFNPF